MHRRTFCKTAVAAAITTSLSACGARQQASDPGLSISAVSMHGDELSIETAAIEELSPLDQEILVLRGIEQVSNQRVAEKLGEELSTVAMR